MSKKLSAHDLGCLVLRIGLGIIFLAHGFYKIALTQAEGTAWTWGASWAPFMHPALQAATTWIEILGGLALIAGLFTRVAAVCLAAVQLAALYLVIEHLDFITSEYGDKTRAFSYLKVGWEYNFALIMSCVAVVLLGAGLFSLDAVLRGRWRPAKGAVPTTAETTPAGLSPPHFDPAAVPAPGTRAEA